MQGHQQMYHCGVNIINAKSETIIKDEGNVEFRGTGSYIPQTSTSVKQTEYSECKDSILYQGYLHMVLWLCKYLS